jgi:hypothetical protein
VTITTDPENPVVGDTVTIAQTYAILDQDENGDEFSTSIDVESPIVTLIAVPAESALETGILLDDEGEYTTEFEPDVEGEYDFKVASRTEYAAAPAFDGDPAGATFSVVISEETTSIRVGVSMDLPIVTLNGHNVTLRVKSHNGTVTEAELVDPLTQVALAATEDSTIQTKLAALVDVATSAIGPDLAAKGAELFAAYERHRVEGSIHATDDTVNVFVYDRAYSNAAAIDRLNRFREVFVRHLG